MNPGPHTFQASTLPLSYVPVLVKHSYGLLILLIENMLAFMLADPGVCEVSIATGFPSPVTLHLCSEMVSLTEPGALVLTLEQKALF